jgi:small-conductance mechanosensitive channel
MTTVVLVVAVAAAAAAVYSVGPWVKAPVCEEDHGEALQSAFVMVVASIAAASVVEVWNLGDMVTCAFGAVVLGELAGVGIKLMISILVIDAALILTRVTKRLTKMEAERDTISAHQKDSGHHVVQFIVFLPAVLFVVALWGRSPRDLVLGAGAFGAVVGLAARQTLGSVLAGFVLLFARPLEFGDWVVVGEEEGVVMDVSVVDTEGWTFGNEHVLVPNEQVATGEIVNRSRTDQLRVTVDVGVDYDVDVTEAARIAEGTMEDCDEVVATPRPELVMDQFGARSAVLTLRFWIDDPPIQAGWRAQDAVVEAVKAAFEREGIKIPFPQRELSGRLEAQGLHVSGTREVSSAEDGANPDSGSGGDGDGDSSDDEATETDAEAPVPPVPAVDGRPDPQGSRVETPGSGTDDEDADS